LVAVAPRLPAAAVVPVDGLVADVNGQQLILNVGSGAGVKVGDVLKVARAGREIKDPATGKVLRRVETALGQVTITQVDAGSSTGTYNGSQAVKVGDRVGK
ncbi:MAG: FlgT C-terminal domain-containing protein, partial [Bryobacteraceae bacterium]